ncbi:MAG: hypothetical protein Q8R92_08585 [Deltaproteobacteria bacterium]|nr:hypothetical protein [Deltaproteobacteria bacterium]
MSREDARWALGLVVGVGVAVYAGVLAWKQALGLVGYFGAYVVAMAAGIALIFVCMALTGVSLELFEWLCKRFPVLGSAAGRVFCWVLSAVILVFAAVVAWHVAWDMGGFASASPGASLIGLLGAFWFPLVAGLVVLARAIWRRYRPDRPPRRAADPKCPGDGSSQTALDYKLREIDDEFVDLGEPPRR